MPWSRTNPPESLGARRPLDVLALDAQFARAPGCLGFDRVKTCRGGLNSRLASRVVLRRTIVTIVPTPTEVHTRLSSPTSALSI